MKKLACHSGRLLADFGFHYLLLLQVFGHLVPVASRATQELRWVGKGRLRLRFNMETSLISCLKSMCLVECVSKCGWERDAHF